MPDQETDAITVPLSRGLTTLEGNTLSELVFREPELGDAIEAEENAGDSVSKQTAFVLARMCGLSLSDFCRIKARDFNTILKSTSHWLDDLGDEGNGEQDGGSSPS